jgi:hypothetical protein
MHAQERLTLAAAPPLPLTVATAVVPAARDPDLLGWRHVQPILGRRRAARPPGLRCLPRRLQPAAVLDQLHLGKRSLHQRVVRATPPLLLAVRLAEFLHHGVKTKPARLADHLRRGHIWRVGIVTITSIRGAAGVGRRPSLSLRGRPTPEAQRRLVRPPAIRARLCRIRIRIHIAATRAGLIRRWPRVSRPPDAASALLVPALPIINNIAAAHLGRGGVVRAATTWRTHTPNGQRLRKAPPPSRRRLTGFRRLWGAGWRWPCARAAATAAAAAAASSVGAAAVG